IRDALHLDDAEGVDCLPNEEIFTELARMGYEKPTTKLTFYKAFFSSQWKFLIHTILQSMSAKRTSWNDFSSAMASAVICLSTGRKFNFSKYIFESLVRNVDSSTKFYMYPRFINLIIQNQLGDLSTHSTKYISPALTQKVFANIRRVGKGCSGVETPLFEGMLIARGLEEQGDVEEQGNEEEHGNADTTAEEPKIAVPKDAAYDQPISSSTLLTLPPQQPQDVPSTSHAQSPPLQPHSLTPAQTQGTHFPMSLLQEALDTCTALARRVEHLEQDKVAQDLEIIKLNTRVKKLDKTNMAKTLKLMRLRKVGTSQRVDTSDDTFMEDVSNQGRVIDRDEDAVKEADDDREYTVDTQVEERHADIYNIDMDHAAEVLSMQEEESEVQEAVEIVTTVKLITKVVAAVSETVSAAAVIPSAVLETISAAAVPTVIAPPVKVAAPGQAAVPSTKRKRGIVIWDPKEESSAKTPTETSSKDKGKGILVEEPKPMKKKQQVELDEAYARKLQKEINQDIDWEVAMDHVKQKAKEEPFIQRYQAMKKRPQIEAQARQNMIMYLKNTAGYRLDYFKGMNYDDIRLIFVAKYNANMEFLLKSKEQMEEEESRLIALINQTPAQKAAKRRKLIKEAKEAESIKQHLHIVPDEDDDVFTEATPLARKVPVVDYQVISVNNKPQYKIIKADDTHQLYASFITMLKNIDREDLETLWSIVKERFSTSKPNNFSDEYLLIALKTMFEILKDQMDKIIAAEKNDAAKSSKDYSMSQDVLIVGSTMRIPLLYRGEYSQWVERFMNYLEEQTDGEAMINSIKNGDQPLPRVTQVSIAGTLSTEQPPLLSNDIYSLIDSNKTAKDLWDALARHMLGSEYGEQDRKAVVLYEYETFKVTEGELLLDTYIRYLQVINDLKKCGYLKDNCELNFKFLNNLQPEWKQYATMMRQNKNLMDINIDAL
nr:hypothetical protein [Tanacetum cinerariifolium]